MDGLRFRADSEPGVDAALTLGGGLAVGDQEDGGRSLPPCPRTSFDEPLRARENLRMGIGASDYQFLRSGRWTAGEVCKCGDDSVCVDD